MSVYPSTLTKIPGPSGGSWQSLNHEYRRVDTVNYTWNGTPQPQSSSTETLYVLWVDEPVTNWQWATWHHEGYHFGTEIKVTHATDVWSDAGTNAPSVASNDENSTHIELTNGASPPVLLYKFAKPTPTSSGSGGGPVTLSTDQPSGSLSFDLPNSEITVTIDSDSPSSTSSDVYALSGPDGFLHQYSHTNGTTSTYTITSATSLAGSWILGSTISGTYTTLDTLTIGGNPPTSSIRKVFCNFW